MSNKVKTTKEVLEEMNTGLFSFRQPAIKHDIYITGIRQPNPNDNTKKITVFIQKSKPNEAAKAAGVKVSEFLHASFKPSGTIKVDDENELTFSGPKKSQVGVVFQSAQPDLYNFLVKAIEEGEGTGYEKSGEVQMTDPLTGKTFKRPQIKLKRKMFGKIISLNVPSYNPTSMGADGKFHKLSPVTLNTENGKYEKKPVTVGLIKFFADDDDLDALAEASARLVDKRVKPFAVDKTIFIKEDGFGNKKVEVTNPKTQGTETDDEDVAKAQVEGDEGENGAEE